MVNPYICLKDSLRIVSYQAAIVRPSCPLVNGVLNLVGALNEG